MVSSVKTLIQTKWATTRETFGKMVVNLNKQQNIPKKNKIEKIFS